MFAQSTLNRGFLVAAATASVCCGSLVMAAPSYASGFTGYYNPVNWTLDTINSTSSVVPGSDAGEIIISTRPDTLNTLLDVNYTIRTETAGMVSFDWNYQFPSSPAAVNSALRVIRNGDIDDNVLLTNISTGTTSGTNYSFAVTAGQEIGFRLRNNFDNSGSSNAIATISNFSAPVAPVIPTPAMLPGLVGMWMAAMRKKRQQEAVKEEA
ncbi:MAG: PTPA-CTERM sorting domain-containing protein [Nodularia sp. (in: Bacteria)]|nr:MAG: PTPA-CTERM sorting domain-containing protein [Nodularia sp. (in: cyanobacteria)]